MARGRPRKVVSETLEKENIALNDMISEEDDSSIEDVSNRPLISSPEWSGYILSLLTEEEFDERIVGVKLPKTDGLVRVAKLLFGKVEGDAEVLFANPGLVVAKYSVYSESGGNFSAVADATPDNTDPPYDKFLTGVASTRAKGRAYRDLLHLNSVNVAEERSERAEAEVMITSAQKAAMKNLSNQLGIDLMKFVNMDGDTYLTLDAVNKNTAARMLEKLNGYKAKKEEVRVDILKGE